MFQALACSQEQQVGIDTSKKNLIVSIPTLRWRERIDQNRDGIVLFCRCAVRASIDLVELVSLVPYQIVHHNVCLTYNPLYASYFSQLLDPVPDIIGTIHSLNLKNFILSQVYSEQI